MDNKNFPSYISKALSEYKDPDDEFCELEPCGVLDFFVPECPGFPDYINPGIYESTYYIFWGICRTNIIFSERYGVPYKGGTYVSESFKDFDTKIINDCMQFIINGKYVRNPYKLEKEHIDIIRNEYKWVNVIEL